MKKSRIIALFLLVAAIVGVSTYNYVMHGGARDLSEEATNFSVSSKVLAEAFTKNTAVANSKYLEKAVAVSGTVTAANANEITLDNGIVCSLKKSDTSIKINQAITIKGRVVGYDDLMEEIKLDQCFSI
jgi:hypothetical protein